MARTLTAMLFGMATALALFGSSNRGATADPNPADKRPTRIALIDMAKVFKSSHSFEKKREVLKTRLVESTEVAKQFQESLKLMKTEHDRFDAGSEERKSMKEQIKTMTAQFKKYADDSNQKFLKAESEIYLQVYEGKAGGQTHLSWANVKSKLSSSTELCIFRHEKCVSPRPVNNYVANYSRNHEIDLVIRFNSEPLEKDDPSKVLNSMNCQVVYENGLDITDEIIAAIN